MAGPVANLAGSCCGPVRMLGSTFPLAPAIATLARAAPRYQSWRCSRRDGWLPDPDVLYPLWNSPVAC